MIPRRPCLFILLLFLVACGDAAGEGDQGVPSIPWNDLRSVDSGGNPDQRGTEEPAAPTDALYGDLRPRFDGGVDLAPEAAGSDLLEDLAGDGEAPLEDAVDGGNVVPDLGTEVDSGTAEEVVAEVVEEVGPTCVPTGTTDPCNGIDDDCDGQLDEDAACLAPDACHAAWCGGGEGCVVEPLSGTPCDDGNPCTLGDTCGDGACHGTQKSCDDGEACNGVESCNPQTGACESEEMATCPEAPPECDQQAGVPDATPGKVTLHAASTFFLKDEGKWSEKDALITAIAQHPSVQAVALDVVLGDLNRQATKVNSIANVECYHTGFTWNSGDQKVTYWYPQGISGTASAYADGSYAGKKVAVVSWYHKPENDSSTNANKGVRISFVDTTGMSSLMYRHALLVEPVGTVNAPDFAAVPVHAGGIAWYKDHLYVADTSKGLRVFDMTRILQVQTGENAWLGLQGANGYHAYGYKYAVPQVTRYKLCPQSCCARFSFVAVDLSSSPPSLITGEYTAGSETGRLMRWPLDAATGRLAETDGRVEATQFYFPGVKKMQGGLTINGTVFVSSSDPKTTWLPSPGTLFVGNPGQSIKERRFPYPPEDLHYSPFSDNLWSLTENPGSRDVFAVKSASMAQGCD